MASPALLAPAPGRGGSPRGGPRLAEGLVAGGVLPIPADVVRGVRAPAELPSFLTRFRAELSSRPVRLVAALVATAVAPALLPEISAFARAAAVISSSGPATPPTAETPGEAAAVVAAAGRPPVVPVPGDLDSWRAGAQKAAATCPGLPPEVLIAIGRVETDLGVQTGASYAGAVGPMQFLPATWAVYGADGDGDGRADVMNPLDALHGAARLLCANGGGEPHRLRSAVWNYNRSGAYVERVAVLAGVHEHSFRGD